jgi:hypothetical protein
MYLLINLINFFDLIFKIHKNFMIKYRLFIESFENYS